MATGTWCYAGIQFWGVEEVFCQTSMGTSRKRSSPPCEDILPEGKSDLYQFFLGSFQELAGNYAGALTTFSSLQKSWGKEYLGGYK